MAGDKEHRIRERAHQIWEKEGRPHGEDKRHWELAEGEVSDDGKPVKQRKRSTPTGATPAKATPAKAAPGPKTSRSKKPA